MKDSISIADLTNAFNLAGIRLDVMEMAKYSPPPIIVYNLMVSAWTQEDLEFAKNLINKDSNIEEVRLALKLADIHVSVCEWEGVQSELQKGDFVTIYNKKPRGGNNND